MGRRLKVHVSLLKEIVQSVFVFGNHTHARCRQLRDLIRAQYQFHNGLGRPDNTIRNIYSLYTRASHPGLNKPIEALACSKVGRTDD